MRSWRQQARGGCVQSPPPSLRHADLSSHRTRLVRCRCLNLVITHRATLPNSTQERGLDLIQCRFHSFHTPERQRGKGGGRTAQRRNERKSPSLGQPISAWLFRRSMFHERERAFPQAQSTPPSFCLSFLPHLRTHPSLQPPTTLACLLACLSSLSLSLSVCSVWFYYSHHGDRGSFRW